MVKTSLDAEANSNVQYVRWHLLSEGWLYDFEKPKRTQARRSATTRHTDHGDRGARGSSGSCSANGQGGCRIFANYCYSVRVCARGLLRPNLETASVWRRNTLSRSQAVRSGRNAPFRWIRSSKLSDQHSSPHTCSVDYTDLTAVQGGEFCIHRGSRNSVVVVVASLSRQRKHDQIFTPKRKILIHNVEPHIGPHIEYSGQRKRRCPLLSHEQQSRCFRVNQILRGKPRTS